MARKRARPIYLLARRLVDPDTGAEVSALIPRSDVDHDLMRKRGLLIGDTVRAEIKKPRNTGQHYRAHALGQLVERHIEPFAGWDPHDILKELQRESGIECDIHNVEVPGEGTLRVVRARSMDFDAMDESEFQNLFRGICRHICDRYWPQCSPEEIDSMIHIMPGEIA